MEFVTIPHSNGRHKRKHSSLSSNQNSRSLPLPDSNSNGNDNDNKKDNEKDNEKEITAITKRRKLEKEDKQNSISNCSTISSAESVIEQQSLQKLSPSQSFFNLHALLEGVLLPLLPLEDLHSLLLMKSFKSMSRKDLLLRELAKRVQTQQCHPDRHRPGTKGHFCFCSLLVRLFSRYSLGPGTGVRYDNPSRAILYSENDNKGVKTERCMFAKTDYTGIIAPVQMLWDTHGYQRINEHELKDQRDSKARRGGSLMTGIVTVGCSVHSRQLRVDRFNRPRGYSTKNILDWNRAALDEYRCSLIKLSRFAPYTYSNCNEFAHYYTDADSDDDFSDYRDEKDNSADKDADNDPDHNYGFGISSTTTISTSTTPTATTTTTTTTTTTSTSTGPLNNYSDHTDPNHQNDLNAKKDNKEVSTIIDHSLNNMNNKKLLEIWPGGQMDAFRDRFNYHSKYIVPSYETYRAMANRKFSTKGLKKFKEWQTRQKKGTSHTLPLFVDKQTKVKHWVFTEKEQKEAVELSTKIDQKIRYHVTSIGWTVARSLLKKQKDMDKFEMEQFLMCIGSTDPANARSYDDLQRAFIQHGDLESQVQDERQEEMENETNADFGPVPSSILTAETHLYIGKNLSLFVVAALNRKWIQIVEIR
jgi:hypothetical protein